MDLKVLNTKGSNDDICKTLLALITSKQNYTVSKKKTGPIRFILHNSINSQYLLIISGRERRYSILN